MSIFALSSCFQLIALFKSFQPKNLYCCAFFRFPPRFMESRVFARFWGTFKSVTSHWICNQRSPTRLRVTWSQCKKTIFPHSRGSSPCFVWSRAFTVLGPKRDEFLLSFYDLWLKRLLSEGALLKQSCACHWADFLPKQTFASGERWMRAVPLNSDHWT